MSEEPCEKCGPDYECDCDPDDCLGACDNCGDVTEEDHLWEITEQSGRYCEDCIDGLHWTAREP